MQPAPKGEKPRLPRRLFAIRIGHAVIAAQRFCTQHSPCLRFGQGFGAAQGALHGAVAHVGLIQRAQNGLRLASNSAQHIAELAAQIAKIYEKENPARAEAYIRKALNAKSKNLTREDMRLFNKLGVALRKQGKWQEAVVEYQRALEVDPQDDTIYYNMGMAYAEAENFSDALKCMEKALSFNPDLPYVAPGVAYNVGMVMFKSARRAEAKRCFEAALEQNPNFEPGKQALKNLQA